MLVTEHDHITAELIDELIEPVFKITADDPFMEVTIQVQPGYRLLRSLRDSEPSSHAILELEELAIPHPIETGEVLKLLREMGVVQGINHEK